MLGGYPAVDFYPIQGMVVRIHTESCLAAFRTVPDLAVYDKLGVGERVEQAGSFSLKFLAVNKISLVRFLPDTFIQKVMGMLFRKLQISNRISQLTWFCSVEFDTQYLINMTCTT